MGYAYYEIYRGGEKIQAGYSVEAECEEPGCEEQIDRGLAYLCGETPGGDEYGCGGYFCGEHLHFAPEGQHGERCLRCHDKGAAPLTHSPDAMVVTFGSGVPG